METDQRQIFRQIQKKLQAYRDERKGPTILVIQSLIGNYTNCYMLTIEDVFNFRQSGNKFMILFILKKNRS